MYLMRQEQLAKLENSKKEADLLMETMKIETRE